MQQGRFALATAGLVALLLLALAGCAVVKEVQKNETADREQLLAAAGFKVRPADTPEKLANLEAMSQRKLLIHEHNGKTYYVYADDLNCKCLYVGNQRAYDRFQQLQVERQIVAQERMIAEVNTGAAMNWDLYGPWDPWW